jgi:hypothetical protein
MTQARQRERERTPIRYSSSSTFPSKMRARRNKPLASMEISFSQITMQGHPARIATRNGTNLEHAHLLNQRVILEAIRLRGPVSRIEIARVTNLMNRTVFNVVDGLQRAGLIQKFGLKSAEQFVFIFTWALVSVSLPSFEQRRSRRGTNKQRTPALP